MTHVAAVHLAALPLALSSKSGRHRVSVRSVRKVYGFRFPFSVYHVRPIAATLTSTAAEPLSLDPEQREFLRSRSKALFGNRDRLEVAVGIALSKDGAVNATDLCTELGMAHSRVRNQLVALAEVGLLVSYPQSDVKRWYMRQESAFWQACIALVGEWILGDAGVEAGAS